MQFVLLIEHGRSETLWSMAALDLPGFNMADMARLGMAGMKGEHSEAEHGQVLTLINDETPMKKRRAFV